MHYEIVLPETDRTGSLLIPSTKIVDPKVLKFDPMTVENRMHYQIDASITRVNARCLSTIR